MDIEAGPYTIPEWLKEIEDRKVLWLQKPYDFYLSYFVVMDAEK